MAKFERFDEGMSPERMLPDGRQLAADFSAEEAEIAYWLNDQFNIAGENLPPRYAQTLLGDPRHAPAGEDYETHLTDEVFCRLHLTRTAPPPKEDPTFGARLRAGTARLKQRVTRQGTVAVMALLMLVSYNALGTGVAMASMLQLFAGRGGTQSVGTYPKVITTTGANAASTLASRTLNFAPRWPGAVTHDYRFMGMDLLTGQWWTKGALVVLHYQHDDQAGAHHLTMLEFLPRGQLALQVVQDGFTSNVQIGDSTGVFVWGHWVRHPHQQMAWESGQRAELVYGGTDVNAPVIWIAADNLDAVNADQMKATLTDVAGTLQSLQFDHVSLNADALGDISARLSAELNEPFSNDIIALTPQQTGSSDPVVYVRVGPAFGQEQNGGTISSNHI